MQGMEQLCQVKAEAAGPHVVVTVQAAGTSLESRLQVHGHDVFIVYVDIAC